MAYFERLDAHTFRATEHTAGVWNTAEQHIAPALGLLAHCVETDRDARRDDGLVLTRAGYDILGTVPIAEVEVRVDVVRPGRTVELVQAALSHAGRDVVVLRAWLMAEGDTGHLAGSALPVMPTPDEVPVWDPTTEVWASGGYVGSVEVRRDSVEPGRARFWTRTSHPLVAGEPIGETATAIGLLDIANGMAVRVAPSEAIFPNIDFAAHLFRQPRGPWMGCDTTVSFGPTGVGVTSSVLHDVEGPVGTLAQQLTVRPRC